MLTDNLETILNDPEIDIGIELVGGTTVARDIVRKLLESGKDVVTANKALLAEHGTELFSLAHRLGRVIAFEASCCGGIPIINTIRDGLAANRILAIYGIVNGTCNFILTQMTDEGRTYAQALKDAQSKGYAEADPTLDVNGSDSAHKLALLAGLSFKTSVSLKDIFVEGIEAVSLSDIRYGGELGYVLKLLAVGIREKDGISLRVHPAFVWKDDLLAQVKGSFNAVSIYGHSIGHILLYGRGAGRMPTASAVVADIADVASGNARSRQKAIAPLAEKNPALQLLSTEALHSRYYVRLKALDKPGTMAKICTVFGNHQISLASVLQHEGEPGATHLPIVVMTARACEGNMQKALVEMAQLNVVSGKPVCIRVLEEHPEELAS
jgi:homoserine dehydrogenase